MIGSAGATTFKACCAETYGSDLAAAVLGPSFHPGGLRLTDRLAELADVRAGDRVLDVASGPGTTALRLWDRFGARVEGIDLSSRLIERSNAAVAASAPDRPVFRLGDAEALPDASFDHVFCECALSTFPDKRAAVEGFARSLRAGGRVCVSDVVVEHDRLPAALADAVGAIACIADALPLQGYLDLLHEAGWEPVAVERHDEAITEMAERIDARIRLLTTFAGEPPAVDTERVGAMVGQVIDAVRAGVLGYVVLVARRRDV